MKWIIDSLVGTIESIDTSPPGGFRDVKYFIITFEEYKNIRFKIFRDTAIKYGIYDELALGGFNRQDIDSLKGRRAEVRVRQENPGKNDWYVVEEYELIE
jgi:hypothetical protein